MSEQPIKDRIRSCGLFNHAAHKCRLLNSKFNWVIISTVLITLGIFTGQIQYDVSKLPQFLLVSVMLALAGWATMYLLRHRE